MEEVEQLEMFPEEVRESDRAYFTKEARRSVCACGQWGEMDYYRIFWPDGMKQEGGACKYKCLQKLVDKLREERHEGKSRWQ